MARVAFPVSSFHLQAAEELDAPELVFFVMDALVCLAMLDFCELVERDFILLKGTILQSSVSHSHKLLVVAEIFLFFFLGNRNLNASFSTHFHFLLFGAKTFFSSFFLEKKCILPLLLGITISFI